MVYVQNYSEVSLMQLEFMSWFQQMHSNTFGAINKSKRVRKANADVNMSTQSSTIYSSTKPAEGKALYDKTDGKGPH